VLSGGDADSVATPIRVGRGLAKEVDIRAKGVLSEGRGARE